MSTVRRADGDARSRAGTAVDTATVLGLQQMRPPFLDHVRRAARIEARDTSAGHARCDNAGANGSEAGCRRCVRRSGGNRGRQSHADGPASLTSMFSGTDDDDLDDDDRDDEKEEVEEDEEDDGDEEVWQVRLT
jgi:hypothetical protein